MIDSSAAYQAMREGWAACVGQRQAVIAEGPEATSFLQGQLSQDIEALAPGETAWSLLLQPQGKIAAWLRVTRRADDEWLLDTDTGWAEVIIKRLTRFKLRTKCELSIAPWTSVTIVGPHADEPTFDGAHADLLDTWAGLPVRTVFIDESGVEAAGIEESRLMSGADLDVVRIEAGVPRMGSELDESTIPATAGIVEQSVSFTKGCYTGQELVARIDSRGNNVPRMLRGVVLGGGAVPEVGTEVLGTDGKVGVITSAALSPATGAPVGLAYITRATDLGSPVTVEGVAGEVRELPLLLS